jgi:hypothetical protein
MAATSGVSLAAQSTPAKTSQKVGLVGPKIATGAAVPTTGQLWPRR